MKKIICLIVSFVIILGMMSTVCLADDTAYWKAQKAYADARKYGNENAIVTAVKMIEAAYANPKNATEYGRVAQPIYEAAKIYEKQTKYDLAVQYYQKALKYFTWIHNKKAHDYTDYLLNIPEQIRHLSVEPEVYTATSNTATLPYYGAKYEPKAGTYFGSCNTFEVGQESAFLLYVRFGTEKISNYSYRIPNTEQDYFLEIAWNAYPEDKSFFDDINSGKMDSYITEQLKFLNTLRGKIFLRFAAEMNNWEVNTKNGVANAKAFKDAYIRIAKKARSLCPNVVLVFSPNDICNRNVKVTDFYPGNAYVDWVGISSYRNISGAAAPTGTVSGTDAFYCRGDYENQILQIRSIVETYGFKKPIMISECGFCYKSNDGRQTETHAVKRLKEFYTWVNRVYPMVKAVWYFDSNGGSSNQYLLSGNAKVEAAYKQTVAANTAMQSTLPGKTPMSFVKVDNFNEKCTSMEFSAYAYYPAHRETMVTVYVDGVKKVSSNSAPYSVTVNTGTWSAGVHTVRVCAKSGSTSRSVIKVLNKNANGVITCIGSLRDVADSHWANGFIDTCLREGIFKGNSFTTFTPDSIMTRAMFVQVLANISGADLSPYTAGAFSDVKSKDWFCKPVMWANKLGIVNGVAPGKFDPNGSITREQMCVMLRRYANKMRISMPTGVKATAFADQSKIGSWAKDAVVSCQKAGLISGEQHNGKYYFNPAYGTTRAQACKIFSIFRQF